MIHVTVPRTIVRRARIDYRALQPSNEIGCILLTQPTFFTPDAWVRGPTDWPPANLRHKKYDLATVEGLRLWEDCFARTIGPLPTGMAERPTLVREDSPRYGAPQIVEPRLGQGIFRVAVMDAYSRACAITHEHSLPALEASVDAWTERDAHRVVFKFKLEAVEGEEDLSLPQPDRPHRVALSRLPSSSRCGGATVANVSSVDRPTSCTLTMTSRSRAAGRR